jgi:fatty acid desaturase
VRARDELRADRDCEADVRRFLTLGFLALAALVASARTEGELSWWLLLAAVWLHPVPPAPKAEKNGAWS